MAREVRRFSPTVPAGTAIATPATTALAMPARIVRRIVVRIPPGPQGRLGFRIGSGGVQVIPWESGTWLVGDNETLDFELEGQISSGSWQLIAYNIGTYTHAVYLTFYLDPPQLVPAGGAAILTGPLDVSA